MATLFTRILGGELPGRFVWRDEHCAAFLTINPLAPGHTLVVPIAEVDHWIDLPAEIAAHLWRVSQSIGQAQQEAFSPVKVAVLVVGEEVPHCHIHLVPYHELSQVNFANADPSPSPESLDQAADSLRAALRAAGHREVTD
ncbi:MAG: HIT family protein [Actinomycetota bacterium]|nr:HIT family protein [Actinomycetota bacterium]